MTFCITNVFHIKVARQVGNAPTSFGFQPNANLFQLLADKVVHTAGLEPAVSVPITIPSVRSGG